MTAMIRHHTEQLHRKAAKCAPAFTLRNDPTPEGFEEWVAVKMREGAIRERYGKPPAKIKTEGGVALEERRQRVAEIMSDGRERTVTDVCNLMGAKTLADRANVANALSFLSNKGVLSEDRIRIGGPPVLTFVAVREPHVSCKDRIAAAKREAGA